MGDHSQPYGGANLHAPFEGEARERVHRDRRRMEMHAAEGHAGSTPRDNPDLDRGKFDERRVEFQQVLGH